jgi:hydroxymethylpyrimidine pyrophosphatase-like HAD family hydrolase
MTSIHVTHRSAGQFAHVEGVIFDFDGTAVAGVHDRRLSPRLIDAVAGAKSIGLTISIATASKWTWIQEAAIQLSIDHPVIVSNGVYGMQVGVDQPTWQLEFQPGAVEALLDQIPPGTQLNVNEDADHVRRDATSVAADLALEEINYVWVAAIDREIAEPIVASINNIPSMSVVVFESTLAQDAVDLVITPETANKLTGVERLRDAINAHDAHWVGVGDGPNDRLLFDACQIGVAMGNATEQLKSVADFVTDSQPQDGLALLLEAVTYDRQQLLGK